jgi:hypothetical protein
MKRLGFPAKLALVFSAAAILLLLWAPWRTARVSPSAQGAATTSESSARKPAPPASVVSSATPAGTTPSPSTDREVIRRPLAVAKESASHAWTAEDARAPEVIRKLAHNEWEERRLLEENARITGRQLVYRKEPVFLAVERAFAKGESVVSFTLPGFNGQELEVQVDKADLAPSGLSGTFTGRLPGLDQSLVTLAFKQGREAFTVVSPEDGVFLQGHPREPGELLVTSFLPDAYLSLPGGEPIRTAEQFKPAE